MSAAKRKGKKNRAGKKRGAAKRPLPWGTIITGLIIIAAACSYMVLKYGAKAVYPVSSKSLSRKQTSTISLYYADPTGEWLTAEQRVIIPAASPEERVERAIQELLKGPQGQLVHPIPPATELRSVRMEKDGVVWLDFSAPLVAAHPGGSSAENLTVYSIVNTVLLNVKDAHRVGILVEGKSIDTLAGHLDCSRPFAADTTVIR